MPKARGHQRDWLAESANYVEDDSLKKRISQFLTQQDNSGFEQLFENILEHFNATIGLQETNDLSNLALLSANINRSYGNALFPVKREKIIEKDRTGTFIPLCTRNVFAKYYSRNVEQMTFWSKDDRESYMDDIRETLKPYLI